MKSEKKQKSGTENPNTSFDERGIWVLHQLSKSAVKDYLEHLLSLIVNLTSELIQCDICSIMTLDPKKNTLLVRATQSLDQEYLKERPYKLENSLSGQAILQGKPLQWEDVSQEPKFQYRTLAERLGLKSLLSIPMIIESRPIGVINFYTTRPRKFSEKEIKFLEAIANHASLAIEKTELSHQTKRMKQALEDRKVIERAKGILMEKKKLTEKEAHELLRKTSMNTRKTMEEIAKAILLAEKI